MIVMICACIMLSRNSFRLLLLKSVVTVERLCFVANTAGLTAAVLIVFCLKFNANSINSSVLTDAHCLKKETWIWTQYLDLDGIQNLLGTYLFKDTSMIKFL